MQQKHFHSSIQARSCGLEMKQADEHKYENEISTEWSKLKNIDIMQNHNH